MKYYTKVTGGTFGIADEPDQYIESDIGERFEELEYRLEKQKETSSCRNSQIATLQKRVKELEAENDHTAFDALAEKYELAKDKIKTLEAEKEKLRGGLSLLADSSNCSTSRLIATKALRGAQK